MEHTVLKIVYAYRENGNKSYKVSGAGRQPFDTGRMTRVGSTNRRHSLQGRGVSPNSSLVRAPPPVKISDSAPPRPGFPRSRAKSWKPSVRPVGVGFSYGLGASSMAPSLACIRKTDGGLADVSIRLGARLLRRRRPRRRAERRARARAPG